MGFFHPSSVSIFRNADLGVQSYSHLCQGDPRGVRYPVSKVVGMGARDMVGGFVMI